MTKVLISLFLFAAWLPAHLPGPRPSFTEGGIVHAILFYSPSCGHCHYVISETLPPLVEKYGDQLQIYGINVATPEGQELYLSAIEYFGLESAGVPFLVIGNQYLIGSRDIPEQFPGLVAYHYSQGGVDWPPIPGLLEALGVQVPAPSATALQTSPETATAPPAAPQPQPVVSPTNPAQDTPRPLPTTSPAPAPILPNVVWDETPLTLQERLALDPAGNSLAILVLLGMLAAMGIAAFRFYRLPGKALNNYQAWAILALCIIGLGVAGYLAFVETTHTEAVCGPVGDCNTVQQSEYARLFGILPIGILGLAGYVAIIAAWLVNQLIKGRLADYAALAMLGMTTFGTLFSIYLTFLEPFVIGATCAWCLTSAIIMTALMLLSLPAGKLAFVRWRQPQKKK